MKNLLFYSLFILFGYGANAQASLGFADNSTPGLSDTILMNSTVTYGVSVQNTGNQPFVGNFTVYVAIYDSSAFFQMPVDSTNVTTNSLQPGDTSGVLINQLVAPTKFMDGNNTVVIWPVAPGYYTTDSIFKNVFVLTFEGTDELSINQLNIYPNPVTSDIFIQSEFKVESVRILSANGKEIISTNQSHISLSNFENGLYIVEVRTENGKILRKKIIVKK